MNLISGQSGPALETLDKAPCKVFPLSTAATLITRGFPSVLCPLHHRRLLPVSGKGIFFFTPIRPCRVSNAGGYENEPSPPLRFTNPLGLTGFNYSGIGKNDDFPGKAFVSGRLIRFFSIKRLLWSELPQLPLRESVARHRKHLFPLLDLSLPHGAWLPAAGCLNSKSQRFRSGTVCRAGHTPSPLLLILQNRPPPLFADAVIPSRHTSPAPPKPKDNCYKCKNSKIAAVTVSRPNGPGRASSSWEPYRFAWSGSWRPPIFPNPSAARLCGAPPPW